MTWANSSLVLYHGTIEEFANDIDSRGVSLSKCIPGREFARGFYTTSNRSQAGRHANFVYDQHQATYLLGGGPQPNRAALLRFEVDRVELGKLLTLSFVSADSEWVNFVDHCLGGGAHTPSGIMYDVVYGPIRGYRLTALPRPNEQISFHSDVAISLLKTPQVFWGSPKW